MDQEGLHKCTHKKRHLKSMSIPELQYDRCEGCLNLGPVVCGAAEHMCRRIHGRSTDLAVLQMPAGCLQLHQNGLTMQLLHQSRDAAQPWLDFTSNDNNCNNAWPQGVLERLGPYAALAEPLNGNGVRIW